MKTIVAIALTAILLGCDRNMPVRKQVEAILTPSGQVPHRVCWLVADDGTVVEVRAGTSVTSTNWFKP